MRHCWGRRILWRQTRHWWRPGNSPCNRWPKLKKAVSVCTGGFLNTFYVHVFSKAGTGFIHLFIQQYSICLLNQINSKCVLRDFSDPGTVLSAFAGISSLKPLHKAARPAHKVRPSDGTAALLSTAYSSPPGGLRSCLQALCPSSCQAAHSSRDHSAQQTSLPSWTVWGVSLWHSSWTGRKAPDMPWVRKIVIPSPLHSALLTLKSGTFFLFEFFFLSFIFF